jgi:chromodomain-helicase-DNA-binding protein 1
MNGHPSPDQADNSSVASQRRRSDSDNSDVNNHPSGNRSPSLSGDANGARNGTDDDIDMDESDVPTPDNASEDADFDMKESPSSQHEDDVLQECASSTDSSRAPKRKAAVVEDEFMRANPELYGLRRSVRMRPNLHPSCSNSSLNQSTDSASRAAQNCT